MRLIIIELAIFVLGSGAFAEEAAADFDGASLQMNRAGYGVTRQPTSRPRQRLDYPLQKRRRLYGNRVVASKYQHCVTVRVKSVSLLDCVSICTEDILQPRKSRHQRQQR